MYIQGDNANEWLWLLPWQHKLYNMESNFTNKTLKEIKSDIKSDINLSSDKNPTIVQHENFFYIMYYINGSSQGHFIPILLNLVTGKSRKISFSNNEKHNGSQTDTKFAINIMLWFNNSNIKTIPYLSGC